MSYLGESTRGVSPLDGVVSRCLRLLPCFFFQEETGVYSSSLCVSIGPSPPVFRVCYLSGIVREGCPLSMGWCQGVSVSYRVSSFKTQPECTLLPYALA